MGQLVKGFWGVVFWAVGAYGQPSFSTDSLYTLRLLKRTTSTLCRFEGRAPGTKGHEHTVRYLLRQFKKMGYVPEVQRFPLQVYRITHIKARVQTQMGKWVRWTVGKQFLPASDCPSLQGEWVIDTSPRPGQAWWVTNLSPEIRRQAATAQVSLLLVTQSKLTAVSTLIRKRRPFCMSPPLLLRPVRFACRWRGRRFLLTGKISW